MGYDIPANHHQSGATIPDERVAAYAPCDLTFGDLRRANNDRAVRWHPGGIVDWSLSDWFTATAGELGEAGNVIKKLNRERDGIIGNSATGAELRAALAEELADVAIYLDLLASRAGVDLARAVVDKFNKVSIRQGFPDRLPEAEGSR